MYSKCPCCEGVMLRWVLGVCTQSEVPDGKLRMHDCYAVAYQTCDECFWTSPFVTDIDRLMRGWK